MKSLAIARNTFREAVRDKIFVMVAAFGLLMVLSSVIMSPLTVGAQKKIVADVGLSSISIFALLVILFVGSGMVYKEIDKRTIMTILSKPISRQEYLVGKYFGLLSTLAVMMVAMGLIFLLACWMTETPMKTSYAFSLGLSVLEMMVVTSVVLFFSSFTTPVLTSLFTLGVYLAGHTVRDLESFAIVTKSTAVAHTVGALKYVLPNLDLFNVRNAAVHDLPIHGSHLTWSVGYALLYSAMVLAVAGFLFGRREFR